MGHFCVGGSVAALDGRDAVIVTCERVDQTNVADLLAGRTDLEDREVTREQWPVRRGRHPGDDAEDDVRYSGRNDHDLRDAIELFLQDSPRFLFVTELDVVHTVLEPCAQLARHPQICVRGLAVGLRCAHDGLREESLLLDLGVDGPRIDQPSRVGFVERTHEDEGGRCACVRCHDSSVAATCCVFCCNVYQEKEFLSIAYSAYKLTLLTLLYV